MCYECTKELLEVELIISLGKLVKGASPQGIGHQVETRMHESHSQPPFKHTELGTRDLILNDHSSTTERLGQRSLERRLVFKEPEFETKFEHKVDTFYIQIFV